MRRDSDDSGSPVFNGVSVLGRGGSRLDRRRNVRAVYSAPYSEPELAQTNIQRQIYGYANRDPVRGHSRAACNAGADGSVYFYRTLRIQAVPQKKEVKK